MSKASIFAVAAVALTAAGAQASTNDLLIVDLSVPNQVTISADTGVSAATISGADSTGVYFENFYAAAGGSLTTTSTGAGDLTNFLNPSDGSPALFRGGGGTDTGLNVWSWSSDSTVDFVAGTQGFTGSGTWALDPAEYADMLAGNTSGKLYFPADTNDDLNSATFIGTWRVVPTPGTLALAGAGCVMGVRRRRK